MASPALVLAAQINGKKSRGPVTPAGRRRSAANSRKHGLYATTLPFDPEYFEHIQTAIAAYTHEFQPGNELETNHIKALAHAEAGQFWAMRTEIRIVEQACDALPPDTDTDFRLGLAWRNSVPALERIASIESRFIRQANRLLDRLQKIRETNRIRTSQSTPTSTPGRSRTSTKCDLRAESDPMTSPTLKLPNLNPPQNGPANSEIAQSQAIAARYRCEFVDLREGAIDHDLFRSIPVDLMFRYNFVPLSGGLNGTLDIALADPRNLSTIDELSLLLHKKLKVKVATASQIADLLKKTEQSQRVLEEVTEGFALDVVGDEENPEETLSIDRLAAVDSDIAPVIKLVDTTIFNALERRASDIHIESRDQEVVIKYRIDGVLHYAMPPIAKDWHSTIISRIKVMSELDIAERRVPQDGRFRVRYKGRLIDFRVSIMPTIHGEDAVLRVLDKESMSEKFAKLSLDVVGFGAADLVKFRRYIAEPYGMVLVTGPTGSGKTTTLYAALSEIKNDEDKIITIEDPVEYQLKGITQIPVNEKKGLTFARGLRSILRHDPDKIMVGEIRDQETAQIAINSALTGHLVFTTVHANNVVDVLGRFLNMGVEAYNFVSALNCILAQRLVRINCEHCKRPVRFTEEQLRESGLPLEEWLEIEGMEGPGCFECGGTGFRGRTAIHELLDLSDRIRELILDRRPASEIKRLAREEGMTFLRESAVEKVRMGITTLKEINKVTFIE